MPSPPFPGLRPHRQGCQDDRPSRQSLYVTGRHPGAGIPPHVLQMGALGQAPAGRGRACGGHCCRQVWGRGLQGVTLVHPSLLLPQEGPRHGQMVLLGGVPWASTQPAPTAASADPAAPCLRPPAPPLSWEDTVPPGRTVAAASGVVAALGSSRQPEEGGSLGRLHVTGVKARPQGTWGPPTPSHAAGEGQGLAGLATQSRGMGASPVQGARPGL